MVKDLSGKQGNTPEVRKLAWALDPEVRGAAYADTYGTLIVDLPAGRLALCVTDPAAGRRIAAAAEAAHPDADFTRLDVYRCRFSKRALDAVTAELSAAGQQPSGFPLFTLGPEPDMSGIRVTTTEAGTRSAALRSYLASVAGDVPVHVTEGEQARLA
ncbi:hypothetical protein BGM09_01570 [Streptomyces sp. CBMA29]|nr:hypothetical protein [Streptomyces sp. CBMA29]